VDSDGNVYLLGRLKTKAFIGTNFKKEIVLPTYIKNVAKVQIWCAFPEVNRGRSSLQFASDVNRPFGQAQAARRIRRGGPLQTTL
jgi:hypothetical protein